MRSTNRPLTLALIFAALALPDMARADYSFASTFNPLELQVGGITEFIIFASANGTGPIDGSSQTVILGNLDYMPGQGGTVTVSPRTVTDTVSITDGTATGSFQISFTFQAQTNNASATESITNVMGPTAPLVINGDTYTLTNFIPPTSFSLGTTEMPASEFMATLTAKPGVTPEPCSLVLVGLGGVAALVGHRLRRRR